jgi:hypothetical protein
MRKTLDYFLKMEQIRYLPSSRLHRSSWFHQWCPIAGSKAAIAADHGGFLASSVSSELKEGEVEKLSGQFLGLIVMSHSLGEV